MSSAADPDACLPDALKDFVFDLHDSTRRSQLPLEQSTLYHGAFRELSSKYFASTAWPSPQSIASECGGDPLFLALYRELTHRHLHSVSRPSIRDRIDGWHVYRQLFDLLLSEAPNNTSNTNNDSSDKRQGTTTTNNPTDCVYILPDWAFDILHEFVYQFQGFCQFRTSVHATMLKHTSQSSSSPSTDAAATTTGAAGESNTSNSSSKQPSHHVLEAMSILPQNRDAWAVETVLFYLHRLVAIGAPSSEKNNNNNTASSPSPPPAYRYLSIFASVALSRLECLLGDYRASLSALTPIYTTSSALVTIGEETKTPEEIVLGVFSARLSLAYHAGVSYLMIRRYKDAAQILGDICSFMQRGFKTGQLRKLPHSDQFNKNYDRMIALLAIITHICPIANLVMDDTVIRTVRDKHGNQLSKIEAGEEGYEEMFIFACPKFVSPAVPDYDQVLTSSSSSSSDGEGASSSSAATTITMGQDAYKLQVNHFMNEMSIQKNLRKLRSYMKLYTSIGVGKLASFNDEMEEEFLPLLLCYKHKMRQIQKTNINNSNSNNDGDDDDTTIEKSNNNNNNKVPLDGSIGMALDIHYYIVDDMVHVNEAEKQCRFETYFMAQISQNEEILKDIDRIPISL